MVALEDTEPALVDGLKAMMDDFGAAGVHNTLLQLIDQIPKDDDRPMRDPFREPLPDFRKMDAGQMLAWLNVDAVRWTRAFVEILNKMPEEMDVDEFTGNVIGWFANAIEAGRMCGHRELGAAVSLVRTQEALGINLLGDLGLAEAKIAGRDERSEFTTMPVITRKPEKYILLDTGKHMAWKWKTEVENWVREPWPGEEQDWASDPETETVP